jgi:hypothetical protein
MIVFAHCLTSSSFSSYSQIQVWHVGAFGAALALIVAAPLHSAAAGGSHYDIAHGFPAESQ